MSKAQHKSRFKEVEDILNQPSNRISRDVVEFMSTNDYKLFAKTVLPMDRVVNIYGYNYKSLMDFLYQLHNFIDFDDRSFSVRNEVLMDAMVHMHNYVSTQYSLVNNLKTHANTLSIQRQLLSNINKLNRYDVAKFVGDLRNRLVHEVNFPTTLKFDSDWGKITNVGYSISELLTNNGWRNSSRYLSRFDKYIIIEDVVNEYHQYFTTFLIDYEWVIFARNCSVFKMVLDTLNSFAQQYNEISERGFLPVSEMYIRGKIDSYKDLL